MKPLPQLPVGMQVQVVRDVTIQQFIDEPPHVIPANSLGVVPEPDASLGFYNLTLVCPVILESDGELGISHIVLLPWEVIEPITQA